MSHSKQRRKIVTFISLFLASLVTSTFVYVNLLAWTDGVIFLLLNHQQRNKIQLRNIRAGDGCDFVDLIPNEAKSNDRLAQFLLEDFNTTSPNHAACYAFEEAGNNNCSLLLTSSTVVGSSVIAAALQLLGRKPLNYHNVALRSLIDRYRYRHRWVFSQTDLLDFRRVLLVAHFNLPHYYQAAAKVDALYRRIFADILYCGPTYNASDFWVATKLSNDTLGQLSDSVKFAGYGMPFRNSAENFYRCLVIATKRYDTQQLDGILLMSDDMILNVWKLRSAGKSLSKNWMIQGDPEDVFEIDHGRFCNKNESDNNVDCIRQDIFWLWTMSYRLNLLTFYEELETLADGEDFFFIQSSKINGENQRNDDADLLKQNVTSLDGSKFWRWIRASLEGKTGGKRRVFGRASGDCFYITRRYLQPATRFFQLLDRHRVFMEIAVGTVLKTISSPGDLQMLDNTAHDWGQWRGRPVTESYGTSYELVHPFKMAHVHSNGTDMRCVYCNLLKLTHIYANLVRKPCLLNLAPNGTLEIPIKRSAG